MKQNCECPFYNQENQTCNALVDLTTNEPSRKPEESQCAPVLWALEMAQTGTLLTDIVELKDRNAVALKIMEFKAKIIANAEKCFTEITPEFKALLDKVNNREYGIQESEIKTFMNNKVGEYGVFGRDIHLGMLQKMDGMHKEEKAKKAEKI